MTSMPLPLHTQIRDSLRTQILDGQYQQHDKLPSEKQLMESFGVSRITVRHALAALEQEGMVFKIPGKGCYVSKPKPTQQLARLQGFAESMGRQGYEAFNRLISLQTVSANAAMAAAFSLPVGAPLTEIQRVRYLDRQPISFDRTYVSVEIGQRLAREDLATRDIFLILENDYSIGLDHALLSIHAANADADLAAKLEIAPGDAVLQLERVTYTTEGAPLELDYVSYRGDAFRYQLRIARN